MPSSDGTHTASLDAPATAGHPADRLLDALERLRSPVCVGLDPVLERLPAALIPKSNIPAAAAEALGEFSRHVMLAVSPTIPCVKLQSACFERFGHDGVAVLERLMAYARELRMEVILDAKRGDIGISSEHYAAAAFDRPEPRATDWLTVNGYFGPDALEPFLRRDRGIFVLVRTTNPGSDRVQERRLTEGGTVAEAVAEFVAELGRTSVGARGFSNVGAVVGATHPATSARLREIMPQQVFLIPGYGAQGGSVDDVLPCLRPDGHGGVIAASRSIIYAFDARDRDWAQRIADAAREFADEIGRAVGWR